MLQKVEADPQHSESWRMLGKIYSRQGKQDQAIEALRRAVDAMPDSVAAHYDLGMLMKQLGRDAEREIHFQKVCDLAPHSEYAGKVARAGFVPAQIWESMVEGETSATPAVIVGAAEYARLDPGLGAGDSSVKQASYEIQSFDGSLEKDRRLASLLSGSAAAPRDWQILAETGVLYNSNVTLTPITRQLTDPGAVSAQWFANPELEWTSWQNGSLRAGPLARGYFTINESNLEEFNLASYQAGGFVERELTHAGDQWITRLEYLFAIDQFAGETLGDRHSAIGSITRIDSNFNITHFYVSVDATRFVDDGLQPEISSLDGSAAALGVTRFFSTSSDWLPMWSLGLDWESAFTEGDDFRFHALRTRGDATWVFTDRLSLITSAGTGFRLYPDFTGSVSRDEFTWRTAGDLRLQVNSLVTMSFISNYDRFDSDNEDFDIDRFTGGIVARLRY